MRYAAPMTDGELKRIPRLLEKEYPNSKDENDFQLRVHIEKGMPTGQPVPEVSGHGARMLSADDQRIVITRQTSVIYACLAPYPGWDDFIGGARLVFDTLRDKLGYKEVSSIGLRYVNRIDVPLKDDGPPLLPTDYLLVGVALPPNGITTSLRAFQTVAEVEINHDQLFARVTAATAVEALIRHASLLFDIDVIAQVDLPKKSDEFWALVGRMRDAKNSIFESGVTDAARQLFGAQP